MSTKARLESSLAGASKCHCIPKPDLNNNSQNKDKPSSGPREKHHDSIAASLCSILLQYLLLRPKVSVIKYYNL